MGDVEKLLDMNRFLTTGLDETIQTVTDPWVREWLEMLKAILGWHKEDLEAELKAG